ncbi:hypothetical protein GCM10029978_074820 [Actinoallomurus acanthiterrae]
MSEAVAAQGGGSPHPDEREAPAGTSPVRWFLLRKSRQEAERVRAAAATDVDTQLARARAEADAILADARAAGAEEGTALGTADLAGARRRARAIVLGARREAYEELVRRARVAASALRDDPVLMGHLRTVARDLAGPGAQVTEHADGGFVAVGPGTRVDCSLPALADRAVDALGAEVERLWAP